MEKNAKTVYKNNTGFAVTGTAHSIASIRPGHVQGAKDARNVTVIGLYRNGLCTPALAMAHGAKMKDHVEASKHGITVEAMVAAGVDMRRMESSHAQQMGRDTAKAAKIEQAVIAAKPKTMLIVRKGNGQAQVLRSGPVTHEPTLHELAVAVACARANKAAKAKKDREYAALHGVKVTLSPEDQAAIMARMQAKVYVEDK